MNILMLGRWMPAPRSPLKGTREYELARCLARSHQLTLAFATDNPSASGPISALRDEFGDLEFAMVPRGWKSVASAVRLATGESCTLSYFRSEALTRRLADRLRACAYDLIYVSSSGMIRYALELDPKIPVVVDFGSVDSEWWLRQGARRSFASARFFRTEAERLRMAETAIAQRAARCVTATTEAADIVRSLAPALPITTIPNGVNVDPPRRSVSPLATPTVVFNTALKGPGDLEDVWRFCRDVIPAVIAEIPATRFLIVSRDQPPATLRLPLPAGVQLAAGLVDARPLLDRARVAVVPRWKGAAAGVGILEAMGAALPVVTTSLACQGLGVEPGRDLWIADDPTTFAKRVVELLAAEGLRRETGAAGRRFVESFHSWTSMGDKLLGLIASVVVTPRGLVRPALPPPKMATTLGGG